MCNRKLLAMRGFVVEMKNRKAKKKNCEQGKLNLRKENSQQDVFKLKKKSRENL